MSTALSGWRKTLWPYKNCTVGISHRFGEKNQSGANYFLRALPLLLGLFPERRTGTFDTGILVRAGGGASVFGDSGSASRTDDRADWLTEDVGDICLLLTGILDSRGRLVLPFSIWKEEEEEEEGIVV